jgi:hypothetical protein
VVRNEGLAHVGGWTCGPGRANSCSLIGWCFNAVSYSFTKVPVYTEGQHLYSNVGLGNASAQSMCARMSSFAVSSFGWYVSA